MDALLRRRNTIKNEGHASPRNLEADLKNPHINDTKHEEKSWAREFVLAS